MGIFFRELEQRTVRVGVTTANDNKAIVKGSVAEYGSDTVPARRPFSKGLLDKKFHRGVVKIIEKEFNSEDPNVVRMLEFVGADAIGSITDKITSGLKPLIKKASLRSRKVTKDSRKPLVDTGDLLESLVHEVG